MLLIFFYNLKVFYNTVSSGVIAVNRTVRNGFPLNEGAVMISVNKFDNTK